MTFGFAVRLLEFDRPSRHPWLTVEVAEREMACQDFLADPIQVFEQSLIQDDCTVAVSEADGGREISV